MKVCSNKKKIKHGKNWSTVHKKRKKIEKLRDEITPQKKLETKDQIWNIPNGKKGKVVVYGTNQFFSI